MWIGTIISHQTWLEYPFCLFIWKWKLCLCFFYLLIFLKNKILFWLCCFYWKISFLNKHSFCWHGSCIFSLKKWSNFYRTDFLIVKVNVLVLLFWGKKAFGHKIKAKQAQITIGLTYRQRVCKSLKISNLPGFSMITTNKMKRLNSYWQLFLNTFILFWLTNLKMFLKAPWAPKYTNFEGGGGAKKRDFLVKTFQKVLKTLFLACFFFKTLPAAQKVFDKIGSL